MTKHSILIGVLIVALVAGVAIVIPVLRGDKDNPGTDMSTMQETSETQDDCIANPNPEFNHDFTDVSQVRQVVPPVWGNFRYDKILNALLYTDGVRVPIAMPADGALVEGFKYDEEGEVQYYLEFRITCEVYVAFDHVTEPVPGLAALFPGPPQLGNRSEPFPEPIAHLSAGELVGHTTGATLGKNWNFAVYNRGRTNGVVPVPEGANPDRYESVACPFDYFRDDIAAAYRAKFVMADKDISVNYPLCARQ